MASGRKPSICNALSQMASLIPSNYDGTADENGITIPPHLNYYRPSPAQVAAQAASDEADGAIYEEPLCTVFCCCNENPSISRDGKKLRQACVHDVLSAANVATGGNCPCKSEQTFYMTQPQPTWRNPQVRPARGFAKKLLTRYAHLDNYKAKRRPDVICLHDPHGPFAPYNIAVLVEMKFPGDGAQRGQVDAYEQIAGDEGKVKLMTEETCGCRKKSKKTEAEEAQVKAAKKSAEEAAFVAAMIRGGIYIAKGAAIVVGGAVADFAGQL